MRTNVHQIQPFVYTAPAILPLYLEPVKAGFPSPADDFIDISLDLNDYLVHHPSATFFVRVTGNSMQRAGIFSGDLLIVDRSLTPLDNSIIVAVVDGDFQIKRIRKVREHIYLLPENPSYQAVEVKDETQFEVWGVVTSVIHRI